MPIPDDYKGFMANCLAPDSPEVVEYFKRGVYLSVNKSEKCYFNIFDYETGFDYADNQELYGILCYWVKYLLSPTDIDPNWIDAMDFEGNTRYGSLSIRDNEDEYVLLLDDTFIITLPTLVDAQLVAQNVMKFTKAHEWYYHRGKRSLIHESQPIQLLVHPLLSPFDTLCDFAINGNQFPTNL